MLHASSPVVGQQKAQTERRGGRRHGAIKRELIGAEITERALISSALNIGAEGRKSATPRATLS